MGYTVDFKQILNEWILLKVHFSQADKIVFNTTLEIEAFQVVSYIRCVILDVDKKYKKIIQMSTNSDEYQ